MPLSQFPMTAWVILPARLAERQHADTTPSSSSPQVRPGLLRADTVCLPFVDGAAVRDWRVSPRLLAVYPYETLGGKPLAPSDPRVPAYLWRYRSLLAARTMFKKTIAEHGKVWFEHLEHYGSRVASTTKIAFASIATHNHFALFEGAALFNSKAPLSLSPDRLLTHATTS